MIGYRFKITTKETGELLSTGMFTASHEMTRVEQVALLHECTHKAFINRGDYINIEIIKHYEHQRSN